ncbi:phosphoribosylglycinamide formyltransferase [Cocleimonas sp. KMM 6892]|uniref:phosphoribosylglycinamide formyltransferase n=1 Tax=unclassified Cocleimonas TaxID=2639732 RepID=UPI002DC01227|nr:MULTISPECIES: phosphoribosylglycinamide formyltransferase [unclassified Cocleimonas]MEB8431891.1 phosphoribosylglycinamide formyltransferase [Cocleimonas sp. KMM 6892]MEC4715023.1 phosphoribosylglycinamide formyltransferase [Cocleimonas sp. KMM 6895]MEC4744163.1 phosphoribosylglycinamide formyltransferase [Cocleimonas sp. KMM 6896]
MFKPDSNDFKIVVLISGSGSNLQAILDNIESGNIDAKITAVISNRANAYGLERAEKCGIDAKVLDHTHYDSREAFDLELQKLIDSYSPDLIVLAGFMRILSDGFVEHYNGKLINIHPSLLPLYKGLDTHQRALTDKQSEHGASVHFVIPELDAGKVIIQGIVDIKEDDDAESLAQRVHQIEHKIYPHAVKILAEGRLAYNNGDVLYDGKPMLDSLKKRLTDS